MAPLSLIPLLGRHGGGNPPLHSLHRTTSLEASSLSLQSAFVIQRQKRQGEEKEAKVDYQPTTSALHPTTCLSSTVASSSLLLPVGGRDEDPKTRSTFSRTWSASLLLVTTSVVYAAVLRHPKCILTTTSAVTMLLYALQTSVQPRISRKFLSKQSNKRTVALMEEVVKALLATVLYVATTTTHQRGGSGGGGGGNSIWTLSSSLLVAALPAALYAVQGVLTYTALPHLDAVTFNGLSQTKTVSAAFFCWLVLGQAQSPRQVVSIGILVTSAIVFHSATKQHRPTTSTTTSPSSKEWWSKGVLPCLGATAVSGLAGALSQRGLQVVHRDPYLFTIEISVYSALCLLLSMAVSSLSSSSSPSSSSSTKETTLKRDFSSIPWRRTLIPVTFRALGGILTALVHKHAGSVLKGFALVLGLVLSGLLQTAVDQEELSLPQVMGSLLVLLSSWMQFTPQG